MSLFPSSNNQSTPATQLAAAIDAQLKMVYKNSVSACQRITTLLEANPNFVDEYGAYDVYAAISAWYGNTQSTLDPSQLDEFRQLMKLIANYFSPGTVVDDVPTATITFG